MSQRDRVLAALHRFRLSGITQVDFSPPHVIDGGAPITRLAARVQELRDEGFQILSADRRDKCTVYRLDTTGANRATDTGSPGGEAPADAAESPGEPPALFDLPAPAQRRGNAIYGGEAA